MRTDDEFCDKQRRIDGVKQRVHLLTPSRALRRAVVADKSVLCKSYAVALVAARIIFQQLHS